MNFFQQASAVLEVVQRKRYAYMDSGTAGIDSGPTAWREYKERLLVCSTQTILEDDEFTAVAYGCDNTFGERESKEG